MTPVVDRDDRASTATARTSYAKETEQAVAAVKNTAWAVTAGIITAGIVTADIFIARGRHRRHDLLTGDVSHALITDSDVSTVVTPGRDDLDDSTRRQRSLNRARTP